MHTIVIWRIGDYAFSSDDEKGAFQYKQAGLPRRDYSFLAVRSIGRPIGLQLFEHHAWPCSSCRGGRRNCTREVSNMMRGRGPLPTQAARGRSKLPPGGLGHSPRSQHILDIKPTHKTWFSVYTDPSPLLLLSDQEIQDYTMLVDTESTSSTQFLMLACVPNYMQYLFYINC